MLIVANANSCYSAIAAGTVFNNNAMLQFQYNGNASGQPVPSRPSAASLLVCVDLAPSTPLLIDIALNRPQGSPHPASR